MWAVKTRKQTPIWRGEGGGGMRLWWGWRRRGDDGSGYWLWRIDGSRGGDAVMEVVSWGEGWSADEDDGGGEDGWSGVAASVWWFLVSAMGGVDASGSG
ncbi:hypothetical protein Tco_0386731 [Tanacetum coccineum]